MKFYECSAGKIHAVGTDTWVNSTSLPQNVLLAQHLLNWRRKDSHAIVVTKYFGKTANLFSE